MEAATSLPFSLDVEGAEMNVLKQLPVDEVRVDFWFVETR